MKNDLISRSAAKELRDQVIRGERPDIKSESDLLDAVPTVDAVEVVRCKDCKSLNAEYKCVNWRGLYDYTKADDFCSYGERRADDGK